MRALIGICFVFVSRCEKSENTAHVRAPVKAHLGMLSVARYFIAAFDDNELLQTETSWSALVGFWPSSE